MSRLNDLQLSLSNLFEDFGSATPGLATVINLGFAAFGGLVYWLTTGVIAYAGLVLAIMSILAILKWVVQR